MTWPANISRHWLTYLAIKKNFACFGGMGPKFRPFLIHQLTAINQKTKYV